MMVVLFIIVVFELLGSGPVWNSYAGDVADACRKRWWAKMLFIGEWLDWPKCMPWTWYIDNDMVFFIFIPFTILIYKKNRKIAYWIFWFMVISNIVYVFIATYASHIGATITNGKFEFEKYIYRRPWG